MLGKISEMLGRTEGHGAGGGDFREAMKNAERTAPPGLIRKLPLDVSAKSAARANDRVTAANGDLIKAEIALEQVRKENAEREALHVSYVERRIAALREAEADLEKAQRHFLTEARDFGALDGCRWVDFKSMAVKDDESIPTVRIEE